MKNKILMFIYTILIGTISGIIIWSFLKVMNLGIELLWVYIPNNINFKYYTIVVCIIGGLLIGLYKYKYGDSPEELEVVISKVKKDKRYSYKNIFSNIISSISPLILGASIGPEAGLTGIIASLCTWVSDKLKHLNKELQELTSIGITATIGTIFASPMFGFIEPIESEKETKLPSTSKTILYFTAILSSFGIFILLNNITNTKTGMPSTGNPIYSNMLYVYIPLLIIIGILLGYIYFISHKLIKEFYNKVELNIIYKCLIGGVMLGIIGYFLPLTMFSGEEQIEELLLNGTNIGILILILTSILKIILTNICIESGLKGGHFFPMIFSGIAFGFAMSLILNIDPVISMAVVTTSFLANIMKKPIAVVLLLMIVFPVNLIPIMLLSAVISCLFKTPKWMEIK